MNLHSVLRHLRIGRVSLFLRTVLVLLAMQAVASAQQLSIGAYHLQSSVRSSLTQYDYTYTADVVNSGPAAQGVIGTVLSSNPNTLVLKGSVNFGAVPANSTLTSTDTFIIRQNRQVPFDPNSLSWNFTQAQTQPPIANAGPNQTVSAGATVLLSGAGSNDPNGLPLTYLWSLQKPSSSTAGLSSTTSAAPSFVPDLPGSYVAQLVVNNGVLSSAPSVVTITAMSLPMPVASAGGPYTGTVGVAVSFDGSKSTVSGGQTLSYAWSFGDGTTGVGASPTHVYAATGSYTVTLTVTASGGGTAIATTTATMSAVAVPVANAGGPYTGIVGTAVSFDGSSSTAPSGQTLTYAWDFGDGSSGIGAMPSHTYAKAGSYTAILAVTASGGGVASAKAAVTITEVPVPVANAGGPYTGAAGAAVAFDGSSSTAPAGQTLTYAWDFGDSSSGTGVNPTHNYASAGTYTVTLTVTASGGAKANATASVTISAPSAPVANAGGPYTGVAGAAVRFDGSKSTAPGGQTLIYAWDFGDSSSGMGVNPTHAYASAGSYTVTLTVTASGGGKASATASVTVSSATPVPNAGGPYTGVAGAAITFDGSKSTAPTGQTLTYTWDFGDNASGSGVSLTHTYSNSGSYTVTLTVTGSGGGKASATSSVTVSPAAQAPTLTSFAPGSGAVGSLITIAGTNLVQTGNTTTVALSQLGGGTLSAPISTSNATTITFVVPAGAATGVIMVSVGSKSASSSTPLTITTSSSFSVGISPTAGRVIQGQSTTYAVTVGSTNGFTGVATLALSGLLSGVTASFAPQSVAVGQNAILTVTAPSGQTTGTSNLTISATATIDSQQVVQSASASLQVAPLTTTFLGRTVVDDATETPVGGVTVKFLGVDDKGNRTGCSGMTLSDGAGNFVLTNLPSQCAGPQLISYDGLTATSPSGKFAGVNLSYTLTSGKVTASPVLVHLPRIDNAETVQVKQNASTDQIFYFHSIPGVKVTVYAGTTLSLDDGSQPNPFPLVAISIPLDRLPEQMPTTGMLMPFIVAFQPANAVASMPVAVDFPNSFGTAPGTSVTFVTLDPTHGYMVPYGTGTVSSDGSQFVADADPNHAGHAYGLVHFDWHGPATPPPPKIPQNPDDPCQAPPSPSPAPGPGGPEPPPCQEGEPVDVSSGVVTYTSRDINIGGRRGGLTINRTYRTISSNVGPFGIGTSHFFNYQLDTLELLQGQKLINLVMPNGNQFPMSQAPDGTFINTTIPSLRGAVLSGSLASNAFTLRWIGGVQYNFQTFSSLGQRAAYLTSITDLNGNTTNLTLNSTQPLQILMITDPVGRSLNLTYDSLNRVTQIVDPIGRKVSYTYNGSGTLASFTDQAGGVTKYTYDTSNNLATIVDPRGVTTEQNTYNNAFDGRITQQVLADGGVIKFAYTLQNPKVAASPVLQTVVTDPLGHQTTYRFNTSGFLVSATDASGQTRTLTRDPDHFNLVSDYTGNGVCPVCGDPTRGDVHYTFDQYGNMTSQTDALGNTSKLTYDTRFNRVNSITDALGNKTAISYDTNGNQVSVTDANGHTTQTVYDSFGEPTQVIDPTGAKTTTAYDSFGNANAVTNPLGNTTSLTFDGVSRLTQVQDALGRKGTNNYDPLDRVTAVIDPEGSKTQLTYDGIGGLLSLTDAKGNVTSFTYDSRERLATRTDALKRVQSYLHDANSNLTQFTDRRGQVSKFTYDSLNRLTTATYQDSTVTYTYDSAGRLLDLADSMDGDFGYKYDLAGRLIRQSGPTGVVQYSRDLLGRIATEQVVGLLATTYTYDAAGNMTGASNGTAGVTFSYDTRNLPANMERLGGVTSKFNFDTAGQLLSLVHAFNGKALNTQAYTYAADGTRSTAANDISQSLVTQASGATVDRANELLTNGTTAYTYDANGNRLTETNPTTVLTYAWDGRNRLSSVTDTNGNKTLLHYDFGTNLLEVDKSGGSTTVTKKFVVDSLTNVVALTDDSGAQVSVLTGDSIDSDLASVDSGGNVVYQIGDALGGTTSVVSSTGGVSGQLYYEPYGLTTGSPDSRFPFAYTGRVAIAANIYYNRSRFYASDVGRFISEDPLDFAAGEANLYEYAHDDPISVRDPSGNFGVIGAVGGAGLNFAVQFAKLDYKYHGDWKKALRCVNFTEVAVSAAVGFAFPTALQTLKSIGAVVAGTGSGIAAGANAILFGLVGLPIKETLIWEIPALRIGSDCECNSAGGTPPGINPY